MKIAQVLYAQSWGEVTPATIEKGLGGRETAMVKLAEAWAKAGHEVTNFVNVEKGRRLEAEDGYHEYIPIGMTRAMLSNMPWDAVVAWEIPSAFADPAVLENCKVRICEMQVAHFPQNELEAAQKYCHYVAALSDWHAEFLQHSGFDGETVVFPNGVDLKRYPKSRIQEKIDGYKPKNNPRFVYSSSPDRGLLGILRAWPKIRKSFPKAEISVCYGMEGYTNQMKWAHTRQAEMSLEIQELITQPGVTNLEKIGQTALARFQMKADMWLYPLDALWPTETGCITAVENAAAGNPLVISDGDCLKPEFGWFSSITDLPFDEDDFVSKIESILSNEDAYQHMANLGRGFAETRSWERIASQWIDLFNQSV